jgi:hypothetical protein
MKISLATHLCQAVMKTKPWQVTRRCQADRQPQCRMMMKTQPRRVTRRFRVAKLLNKQ